MAIFITCVYFFPTILAILRRNRNVFAILLLNLFFGWTVIGWFGSLIWAAMKDPEEIEVVVRQDDEYLEGRKLCPYCAEFIWQEAKLCRFCGKDLDDEKPRIVYPDPEIENQPNQQ